MDCDYKIFITGHPSTGKKTLADKITEKYPGLKKVVFNRLIADFIETYKKILETQAEGAKKGGKDKNLDPK